jgi:hypothetical protein
MPARSWWCTTFDKPVGKPKTGRLKAFRRPVFKIETLLQIIFFRRPKALTPSKYQAKKANIYPNKPIIYPENSNIFQI